MLTSERQSARNSTVLKACVSVHVKVDILRLRQVEGGNDGARSCRGGGGVSCMKSPAKRQVGHSGMQPASLHFRAPAISTLGWISAEM